MLHPFCKLCKSARYASLTARHSVAIVGPGKHTWLVLVLKLGDYLGRVQSECAAVSGNRDPRGCMFVPRMDLVIAWQQIEFVKISRRQPFQPQFQLLRP